MAPVHFTGGYYNGTSVLDETDVPLFTPWTTWTVNSVGASGATTIWAEWSATGTSDNAFFMTTPGIYRYEIPYEALAPTPETPAQLADRQNREALASAHRLEREAAQREITACAEALLASVLDPVQQQEYATEKRFHVVSRSGVRYRVTQGQAGNVYRLDAQGQAVEKFCIHPSESVPDADAMAAQKLLLDTDEAAFCRIANRTPLVAA